MHVVDTTMFYSVRSGGVKRYLQAKHDWLRLRAPHVRHTVLVPSAHRLPYMQQARGPGVRLKDGYRFPLGLRQWRAQLEALQPDVIEASDPFLPGWATRQASRSLCVPAVAFHHSDIPQLFAQRVGKWSTRVTYAYLRSLYDGFDLVLVPSRTIYERLLAANIGRVHVQRLGVDVNCFQPQARDARLRQRLNVPAESRLLVYAGRLASEKNIPLLMEVVERLGDPYHLLIVGGHRRERIGSRVTLLPYQRSPHKLAQLMASCDAFLHAGDTETYGLIAVEALACGLPVVTASGGPLAEIIDDDVGAIAHRLNVADLAEAVAALFTRELAVARECARVRACTRHAWDAVLPQLLHRYELLAGRTVVSARPVLV